ncbi:unnamed protein product [Pleuronectes platessa]|uniref:Uncharacterized protein n=1 Tax=Pleuronectes platessa TaxID=8262 RepID=A0A9N7YD12_PLEPL|nr:unnamed protein product [Pleuronectes platessa]
MDENDNEEEDNFPPVRFALTEEGEPLHTCAAFVSYLGRLSVCTLAEPDGAVVRAEKRGRRRRNCCGAVNLIWGGL